MLLTNGILCILIQLGLFCVLSKLPTPADALLLQLTFSKETFTHIVQGWGDAGTHIYLSHYYLDMIYPIFYSLFLSGLLKKCHSEHSEESLTLKSRSFTAGQVPSFRMTIPYLPFVAGFLDIIENILHITLLTSGNFSTALITIAALCAWVKWGTIILSLLLASYKFFIMLTVLK